MSIGGREREEVHTDLGIQKGGELGVADARRSIGDCLYVDAGRQVQCHEQRVQLCERAPQRMSNLRPKSGECSRVHGITGLGNEVLTSMTCVAPLSAMILFVSARIVAAVRACSAPNPLWT